MKLLLDTGELLEIFVGFVVVVVTELSTSRDAGWSMSNSLPY